MDEKDKTITTMDKDLVEANDKLMEIAQNHEIRIDDIKKDHEKAKKELKE